MEWRIGRPKACLGGTERQTRFSDDADSNVERGKSVVKCVVLRCIMTERLRLAVALFAVRAHYHRAAGILVIGIGS